MPVIDFENADGKTRYENAFASAAMFKVVMVPASRMNALLDLRVDQVISHLTIPSLPVVASQMMKDLSRVVPLVNVGPSPMRWKLVS